jgi:phage terminase large subunit-like protein
MRTDAQTAMIEDRFVHLPESAPSLAQRPNGLTAFAHGRHDDQVDAIAQNEPADGGLISDTGQSGTNRVHARKTSGIGSIRALIS